MTAITASIGSMDVTARRGAPSWHNEGRDWPNRSASSFVQAAGITWHVQRMGAGPILLLAHGTGAATHSWRALAPLLAQHFTIIAPDLPGHGFTEAPPARELTLPGMAAALGDLLQALELKPDLALGHSAGAAILARMCLDGKLAPRGLISLNGALLPLHGMAGQVFSPLARLFAAMPLVPQFFSWRVSDPRVVQRLMRGTGSEIDSAGLEFYRRLAACPGHVGAALDMMANWQLEPLQRDLPRLKIPLALVVGEGDLAIRPADGRRVAGMTPGASVISLPRLGHLAHEEAPEAVASVVIRLAREWAVLGGPA